MIGNIWATKKYEALKNFKLMFVQPINADLEKTDNPIIAADTVGSGPGEIILLYNCIRICYTVTRRYGSG